jgi:hypothetical protein
MQFIHSSSLPPSIFFLPTIFLFPIMAQSSLHTRIQSAVLRDSIDLTSLPFHQEALDSITALSSTVNDIPSLDFTAATKIDTHTHPIPSWFHALEPLAAGRATPEWNVSDHLHFMASRGITRSILSVSTPQANAFLNESDTELRKRKTVALARLLNEYVAEICRLFPNRFSWLAITPLPYVEEAVTEVKYAIEELGAVGVGVLTNHEGMYPGDEEFEGLWRELDGREGGGVVFVHPTEPVIRVDGGKLVASRPCKLLILLSHNHIVTSVLSFSVRYDDQAGESKVNIHAQHPYVPAWESSTLKPPAQYPASQPALQSSNSLICTGASRTARVLFQTSPSASYSAFQTYLRRRVRCIERDSGMIVRDPCFRIRSRG